MFSDVNMYQSHIITSNPNPVVLCN